MPIERVRTTQEGAAQREPRIAIVHEWLDTYAGSERVLEQILRIFPNADLYAVVDFLTDRERAKFLGGRKAKTTFIQRLPKASTHFRNYLPLMPFAIEQHDLQSYDLVISSSHAVAKGVLTGPDQLHISYVHSPIRYAWDLQHQYLQESGLTHGPKAWLARAILHYIRIWDQGTANRVDLLLANSHFIARRIEKVYRRQAKVIYPPVDTQEYSVREAKDDFYLTVSRLVPYKRVSLIAEAFREMSDKKLVIIGDGPELKSVSAFAAPNVTVLGYQTASVVRDYLQRARAFVFAAEEDFGIAPVEAQACGTPVIAYGRGGALETIRGLGAAPDPTGVFFGEQTVDSLRDAVQRFEAHPQAFSALACRANAERFGEQRFVDEMRAFVETAWREHLASLTSAGTTRSARASWARTR